jgi:hypothetical protein
VSICLQVVALHKDRYVFPVTLKVTKIMGTGVDATFMGIMKVGCRPRGNTSTALMSDRHGQYY